jgi:uncharacterized protein (TIRG00374 family)
LKVSIYSILKYVVLLAIGVVLLVVAFKDQDFDRLVSDLKSANYWWVSAAACACLVAHVLRAVRWNMLIEPLDKGTPPLKHTFYAVMIGYLANLAFPRMGEVSRCGVINKTDKIPLNQLIGTVITERLIDLLMLFVIVGVGILLQYKLISGFLYKNLLLKLGDRVGYASILVLAGGLVLGALLLLYIVVKKNHWGVVKKMRALWSGFSNGLGSVKKMRNKSAFVLYSISIWFFYFLSTYLCLFALDAVSNLGPIVALSVLVFGSLGMLAPVQGGIGAFHWIVAEGLTIYSLPRSDGLAYATIIHSSQTLLILFIGLISVVMVVISSSKQLRS